MAEKVCDDCGKPLKYYEQNNRYYCHTCRKYAPKAPADEEEIEEEEIEEESGTSRFTRQFRTVFVTFRYKSCFVVI